MKIKEYYKWETFNSKLCSENCWCAGIRAITSKRGRSIVVWPGDLHRETAEMIVRVHNEWLELKDGKTM